MRFPQQQQQQQQQQDFSLLSLPLLSSPFSRVLSSPPPSPLLVFPVASVSLPLIFLLSTPPLLASVVPSPARELVSEPGKAKLTLISPDCGLLLCSTRKSPRPKDLALVERPSTPRNFTHTPGRQGTLGFGRGRKSRGRWEVLGRWRHILGGSRGVLHRGWSVLSWSDWARLACHQPVARTSWVRAAKSDLVGSMCVDVEIVTTKHTKEVAS